MSAQPPGRIPFEDIVGAKSWLLPEVNGNLINGDEQRKRKTQAGKIKSSQQKRAQPEVPVKSEDIEVIENVPIKGITASQLEEITKAAEQDGFEKGYDEGLEQGKVDGRKAGYSEGLKAGTEQAESEHGQWLKEQGAHLQELCESLVAPLSAQQQELADAALDLAFGITRHLLHCELIADPQKIIPIVDRALEALPPVEKNIALYLHPDDIETYKKYAPHTISPDAIHASPTLDRGSCQVKSEHSFVDYSIAHRINEFIAALAEKPFDEAAAEPAITPVERSTITCAETELNHNSSRADEDALMVEQESAAIILEHPDEKLAEAKDELDGEPATDNDETDNSTPQLVDELKVSDDELSSPKNLNNKTELNDSLVDDNKPPVSNQNPAPEKSKEIQTANPSAVNSGVVSDEG